MFPISMTRERVAALLGGKYEHLFTYYVLIWHITLSMGHAAVWPNVHNFWHFFIIIIYRLRNDL